MSSLDLFASALGAFILLTIVVFPYFLNTGMASRPDPERQQVEGTGDESALAVRDELDRTRAEREAAQRELATVRVENARLQQVEAANETLRRALAQGGGDGQGLLQAENARLLQDRSSLQGENARLLGEQQLLLAENAGLRDDLAGRDALLAENLALRENLEDRDTLQADNARLLQSQSALQGENARLLHEQGLLRAANATLEGNLAEQEALRADDARLLGDRASLLADNARLVQERASLQADNAQLQGDLRGQELLRAENAQLRDDLRAQASLRAENAALKEHLAARPAAGAENRDRGLQQALEIERRRKFLAVMISWPGGRGDDVDLHVVDPRGNEFYYGARIHAGSAARFEEDSRHGPGNEVWLHPHLVDAGEYRIYANLFDGGPVAVRGTIVAGSSDRYELAPRWLSRVGERNLVATVVVDGDANVEVVR